MSRIFLHDYQYQRILPSSFHEGDFEKIVTLQAPNLYPDYHVIPFKKTVVSPYGNRKPDLVFIAKDYQDWYVVEVEMAYHSFNSHVEPQVQCLAFANYDDNDVVDYLLRQCNELDCNRTPSLVRNVSPKILLILNEYREVWANDLYNKFGAVTSVFEVFHHIKSGSQGVPPQKAYGISHNYPVFSLPVTTKCSVHPHMAFLGIDDNSRLQLMPGNDVMLEFDGSITFWTVIEGPNNTLWLSLNGRNDFVTKKKIYHITLLRDSSLFLEVT